MVVRPYYLFFCCFRKVSSPPTECTIGYDKLCELLTPKGMSFGDTNTSSLFLLLPIIAF